MGGNELPPSGPSEREVPGPSGPSEREVPGPSGPSVDPGVIMLSLSQFDGPARSIAFTGVGAPGPAWLRRGRRGDRGVEASQVVAVAGVGHVQHVVQKDELAEGQGLEPGTVADGAEAPGHGALPALAAHDLSLIHI